MKMFRKLQKNNLTISQHFAVGFISLYQKSLSPDHGWFRGRYPYGFCRFYPSCSQYTKEVVIQAGVIKGLASGLLRVIRCNPFSKPKLDLPKL